jgi:hypothetical protein
MTLERVKVAVANTPGGPGVMNVYFSLVTDSTLTALGALITAVKPYIPSTITYTIPSSGDILDDTTGDLESSWTATAPAPIVGTGASVAAAPAGLLIDFKAGDVVDNHRPIGKMLFVPCATAGVSSSGGASSTAITALNTAAATFLTAAPEYRIWHRPRKATDGPPPKPFRAGSNVVASAATCNPKLAVLRSRRD